MCGNSKIIILTAIHIVGFTIITPNETLRKELELNASPIQERIALKVLHNAGIHTTVSLEHLLPSVSIGEMLRLVESINPYVDSYGLVGKLTASRISID